MPENKAPDSAFLFDTVRADSHHWPFRGRAMAKICSREMVWR